MSWLNWNQIVQDPLMLALFFVAFAIFLAMAWNAGFSFDFFTGEIEDDACAGDSSHVYRYSEFNFVFYVLLIAVLGGLGYCAYLYFQQRPTVHQAAPVAVSPHKETVAAHSGASGAALKQHSHSHAQVQVREHVNDVVQHQAHGSVSPSANVRKAK